MDFLQTFQTNLQTDFVSYARELMAANKVTVLLYHATTDTPGQALTGHLTQINLPEDLSIQRKTDAANTVTQSLNERLKGIFEQILSTSDQPETENFSFGMAITPTQVTVDGLYSSKPFQFNMDLAVPAAPAA